MREDADIMKRIKMSGFLVSLAVCVGLCTGTAILGSDAVVAQSEEEQARPPERFELQPKFPVMTGPADATFEFTVGIMYKGDKDRVFDLNVSGPQGWLTYIAESTYEKDKRLSAIRLEETSLTEDILVVAVAPYWLYPEPGEYSIDVEAVSEDGELSDTASLAARIEARYALSADTSTGRHRVKVTAGERGSIAVLIGNSGTAAFDLVTFSSSTPGATDDQQWKVSFDPSSVEALGPGDEREVEVTIEPPADVVAGDYLVTLSFAGEPALTLAAPVLDIRVNVGRSTAWGWILAGVALAIAATLVVGLRLRPSRAR